MSEFWLLALGGNLPSKVGSPSVTLDAALEQLDCKGIRLVKVSRFYATPCFPEGAGPDYVNAAVEVETELPADALLARLHEIEAGFGRERQSRWAGRTLDIDLIAGRDRVLPSLKTFKQWLDLSLEEQKVTAPQELILPHPRLQDRAFVLVPLNDIAWDWIHPVNGLSVAQMLSDLPKSDVKAVVPL